MTEPDRPIFIQISSREGLETLRAFAFVRRVNSYKKKKDKRGAYLIRLGWLSGTTYSGHRYIVRCMSGALLGDAEEIVRAKLGLAARVVSE